MNGRVVSIAQSRSEVAPIFGMILNVATKHGHQGPIESLGLAVGLRMVRSREEVRDAQQ